MELQFSELGAARLVVRATSQALVEGDLPLPEGRSSAEVLCADGSVYTGCNMENAAYSPTVCAERTAFFKAVYDGHRDFTAIAVCGGKDGILSGMFPPCGVCRQVMAEFCKEDFRIYMADGPEKIQSCTLAELLPYGFSAGKYMDM